MKTFISCLLVSLFTLTQALALDESCDVWLQKLKGAMKNPSVLQVLTPGIAGLKINCSDPKEAEKQIFEAFWYLESSKKLDTTLLVLIKNIKKENNIPALKNVSDEFAVQTLGQAIRSELYDRGYYKKEYLFPGWETITQNQERLLKSFPRVSSFRSETFRQVFLKLTNMPMTTVHKTEVLDRNSRALSKRIEIIRNANSSIKLATWGFHDDTTGKLVAAELIGARKRNVKVQVLVDFQVAQRPGYKSELARMKNSGIEVIGWKSKENPFYGMHSKMLIVDDLYCIEGGRNIGDLYLQDNKWSDLDVYHEGAIAEVINPHLFAKLWNEQISLQRLSYKRLTLKTGVQTPVGQTGTFMSTPQLKKADAVSNVTVYAVMNAKREIEIANAYFITTPGLKRALVAAIKRGVKVRIFSNSMKSVDEPIVSLPIQKSLKEMYEHGAEIYLKTGQTLHTKIFRTDDLSWYGSYNLHPRSGRYELEKVTVTTDYALNRDLSEALGDSLRQGKKVTNASELALPDQAGLNLLFEAIFNQL